MPSVVFLIAADLLIASTGCQRCLCFLFIPPPPSLVLPITHPWNCQYVDTVSKSKGTRRRREGGIQNIISVPHRKTHSSNDVLSNSKCKQQLGLQVAKFERNILQLLLFSPGDFAGNVFTSAHLLVCRAHRQCNYYQRFVPESSVAAGRQLSSHWDSHNDKCPALLE